MNATTPLWTLGIGLAARTERQLTPLRVVGLLVGFAGALVILAPRNAPSPIEASSGDLRRHRLNRGGNRQLNTALHLIAVCQIRDPSPGQAYYQRKLAQAKTPAGSPPEPQASSRQCRLQPPEF